MRKTINVILLSVCVSAFFSSCAKKDPIAATVLANRVDTTTTTKTDSNKSTTQTPPPITTSTPTNSFDALNTQENLFDNIWWVKGAYGFDGLKATTAVAANNAEVGKLNTKKGGVDISYAGRVATKIAGQTWPIVTMDNKIPILISDDANAGTWLSFKNVPSTYYLSSNVTGMKPPFETWFVFRILPNAVYEAFFAAGGNCGYIANNGNGMRIINQDYGFLPTSTAPSLLKTHIGRLVISSQSSASLYIDNALQGTLSLQGNDLNNMTKTLFNVGAVSNQPDWDFAAMYFKKGTFSDNDATTIYNSLATKWKVNTYPDQILLSNLTWSKSNGTYTPNATIINTPNGAVVADPSKWDYQWYWRNNNDNLDIQTPFSTKYQITAADFPAGYASASGGFSIKVVIRPKDTNGKAWRWFDGTFANY